MEDVQEISNHNGKSVVTFTLTLPSQIQPADDVVSLLRHAQYEKRKLGHAAAADAIGNLLSLAKPMFY
jgi:hypothetical protein